MRHSSQQLSNHFPVEDMIDGLMMAYFIFVLKDEAIQFYTQLVRGQVPRRRSEDRTKQLSDAESSAKPTSWSEMKIAFETSYLSADAVARSVEQIATLRQNPNESVTSYVNRHRDNLDNLDYRPTTGGYNKRSHDGDPPGELCGPRPRNRIIPNKRSES